MPIKTARPRAPARPDGRPAPPLNPAAVRLPSLVLALTAALALAAAAGPRTRAAETNPPGILVLPIETFDGSADQRPFVLAAQRNWVQDAQGELRQALAASGRVRLVNDAATRAGLAKLAGEYAYPSSCRSCLTALAHAAGARYIATAAVHKVSDLIIYLGGELDDTATGRPLMSDMLEVKADNDVMLKRAGQALARDMLAHLPQ